MHADSEALRKTLRLWSCGVTIVTTTDGQQRTGMTASSFTSISLEPPLILVCLHKQAGTAKLIEQTGVFAVSILGAHQESLSAQFAGFSPLPEGKDRFYNVETTTAKTGSPILTDSIAWLDCKVFGKNDGSTHWIFVGEVLATDRKPDPVAPLIYHNRAYRQIAQDNQA